MLKGVAIMMMLFLHLFSNPSFASEATPLLWVGDTPFATILARACGPVGFFLTCSGYGLAYAHLNGRLHYKDQLKRTAKLYLNYWLILLIFVGIGHFLFTNFKAGTFQTTVANVTGWDTDAYDHPAWFLLPYCIISISSPVTFRCIDKYGIKRSLACTLILCIFSMYVISRHIAPVKAYHEWYTIIFTYFDLLFSFTFGAAICYMTKRGRVLIPFLHDRQWLVRVLVVMWFCVHCLTGSALFGTFMMCVFVVLYLNLNIQGVTRRILTELGNKSMVMWLTHAFIYGPFFHDEIYGARYPILIFLTLLIPTYLLSIPILKLSHLTTDKIPWLKRK